MPKTTYLLEFRFGNACTLFVDGVRATRATGYGYDKEGTCFGEWIQKNFQPQLLKLINKRKAEHTNAHEGNPNSGYYKIPKLYGMEFTLTTSKRSSKAVRALLDGGCGFQSMMTIFKAIGGKVLTYNGRQKNINQYVVQI